MIIDAHCHLGVPYGREAPSDTFWGAERYLALMDKHSVEKACVQSTMAANLTASNDIVNEEIKKANGRLNGVVRVNPNDKEGSLKEIDMRVKQQGWKMIKLHPYLQGFPIDSEVAFPIFEKARELKIPVQVHTCSSFTNTPGQVAIAAELFPEVTILMSHMGMPDLVEQALIAAKLRPNIVLETALQVIPAMTKEAVRLIGPERVVFGSDSPYLSLGIGLSLIEEAGLTEAEKDWVLGKSMHAILERVPSY
jgi:predicted TIM-barrel fold metal-dependent hydrolase